MVNYSSSQIYYDDSGSDNYDCEVDEAYDDWEREKEQAINNLLNAVDVSNFAIENAQNELNELTKDIPWKKGEGYIANNKNLKYVEYHHAATRSYYKLVDNSVVVQSFVEQALTRTGDLRDKYIEINQNDRFYYIKLAGSHEWSEMLFNPENTVDELANLFRLAGLELGKSLGRYVLPIEEIKILIDGRDFDGQLVSKWQATGFLLLAVVPGSKALKVVSNIADATFVAIKLSGSTLIIDTVKTGIKVVKEGSVVKFLNSSGSEIARIVNGVMTFKYKGFGGDIIANSNKTTTLIGKWDNLKHIWETGLAKHGSNVGGLNILGEPFGSNIAEIWANNKIWLDRAIARGDIIRATANPLDINNLFYNIENISSNAFSNISTLKSYLLSLDSEKVNQLGYYGREIRHLFQNGYNFNSVTKTFVK